MDLADFPETPRPVSTRGLGGDWYRCRWVVEEEHQRLKTGCQIEERNVHTAERLMRLLGLLSPITVRLLHLV